MLNHISRKANSTHSYETERLASTNDEHRVGNDDSKLKRYGSNRKEPVQDRRRAFPDPMLEPIFDAKKSNQQGQRGNQTNISSDSDGGHWVWE